VAAVTAVATAWQRLPVSVLTPCGARERALELARRGGALAIAKRAHEELEASGEKLRPLLVGGVESLTPSERRVAQLAAEGLTNREVAQSLFLTVKTVETHLSHAYRKLGIGSRAELPESLAE
jgi:DNA-binding NarL/FixJ family response regulator